ncbi:MAG: hypothetical protein ACPLSM_07900, partial [Thermosphaera sp.]
GFLEGREIEVSLVRAELTRLPKDGNYFVDPDNNCKPNSQADILYRRWIATLSVPSLGINASVSFYINASEGEYIYGQNTLNFMWENPGRPAIETDRFKVIIFDPEVLTTSGEWKKATLFLVDYRTPLEHLPMNEKGQLLAGYRKVNYKGVPAIEASFGYGYTDYVIDGNPTDYEKSLLTKGVIDLSTPWGEKNCEIIVLSNPGVEIYLDGELVGRSNSSGMLDIPSILPGYHEIMAVDRNSSLFSRQLVYLDQRERKTVDLVLVARTLPPGPFTLGDVSPITLKEGEEATLAFVVVNRGRGTAEGVTARIEAPGFQVISGLETIPNVPAGGSAKAVFRVRPLEGGVKNVKVTVTYTDSAGNSYSDVIESTVTVLARLVVSSSSVSGKPLEIPVTVNGVEQRVFDDWVNPEQKIRLSARSEIVGEGVRYVFVGWSDGVNLSTREVTLRKSASISAVYKVQYLVSAFTPYGSVEGAGWYDEGSTATVRLTATSVGFWIKSVFR